MGSVEDDGYQRLAATFEVTKELREALFTALRKRKAYRNAVALLGQDWKRAKQERHDNRYFYEIAELAPADPTDPLRIYVNALQRTVARTFRLVEPGHPDKPAAWACNFLHSAIEPSSGQGVPSPDVPHVAAQERRVEVWYERLRLEAVVGPLGAEMVASVDEGLPPGGFTVPITAGYGDAEWESFFQQAHDLLEARLQEMRESYEKHASTLPHYGKRRPSRRLREHEDLELIADWYLGNDPPNHSTEQRLRDRAELLGIACPPPPW